MNENVKQRPQVTQARRFADSLTYNAWSALHRAGLLLSDACDIEEVLKAERELDDAPVRAWFGFEVISYYLVGFATCLEWHVRTRLADLYTYRPDAIDKKTLDGKVSAETLAQMIRAGVTIPHLLSASTTIGSAEDFYGSLQRIYDALDIHQDVAVVTQPEIVERVGFFGPIEQPTVYATLTELFSARHALVHEIGVGRQAWPGVGDNWNVQEILKTGHVVLETMRAFERSLSAGAPADFPNLLDARFNPVDEQARLRGEVAAAVERIGDKIGQISQLGDIDERDAWTRVIAHQDALQNFIASSKLFRRRSTDRGPTLAKLELEQRLKMLGTLEVELGDPSDAKGR
jgi:hypothetical protein